MTASQTPTTAEELRGAGLRVTAARVALLEIVRDGDHLGVEAIAAGVRERIGHISLQAVYDALHALTAAGLVRRIEPAGTPPRFEGRVGDNHHHVVCRSCGVVADVDCAVGEAPCLTASDDHGFSIDEAEVIYWGLCPDCSTATQFLGTVIRPSEGRRGFPCLRTMIQQSPRARPRRAGNARSLHGPHAPHRGRRQPRVVAATGST